ncbi:unnamed protein product [Prorocentrum cordatum]|uniref:Coiled-coil domain-containing protein 153 n=1 Tax=Prorocentrum cordatum TaxID=2364126 RepID=A0ABN9T2V3_9DINO|nr:unnamed protein product [Polarella glacialis]
MEKEISSLQNSFKHRSKQLAALTKSKRRDAASAGQDGEADDLRLEELRELDKEFAKTAADMHQRLAAITRDWQRTTAELGDVAREVATCDQQDRALAERSGALQAAMQKAHNSSNPQLVGDLKDVTYFKESNRRTKLRYVERREELDRQEQHLAEEKQLAEREIKRVEGQRKMIRLLQRGELSSKSAATAALEAGFKAAARKRAELAASDPALLAGSGCFSGLTEVLQVADSAVDSTSTRLREVTTVSGGGASVVLEETLEAIVRLRTECIALARARLWRLQRSDRAPSLAPVLGDDSGAASPGASGVGASAQPSHRHHHHARLLLRGVRPGPQPAQRHVGLGPGSPRPVTGPRRPHASLGPTRPPPWIFWIHPHPILFSSWLRLAPLAADRPAARAHFAAASSRRAASARRRPRKRARGRARAVPPSARRARLSDASERAARRGRGRRGGPGGARAPPPFGRTRSGGRHLHSCPARAIPCRSRRGRE